jgi:hypothetical protein
MEHINIAEVYVEFAVIGQAKLQLFVNLFLFLRSQLRWNSFEKALVAFSGDAITDACASY